MSTADRMSLAGRKALVTGASKGIGLETSHLNGDAIFIDGGYTAL